MAIVLPPPPLKAQQDNFAWLDWYNKLYKQLNSSGAIAWNQIDFTGSSLSDLQLRPHNALTGVQGGLVGEHYHVSSAVYNNITNLPAYANIVVTTGSYSNPSWITSLDGSKLSGTVVATNGVVTTGSYANPSWITSLAYSKLTGTPSLGTIASQNANNVAITGGNIDGTIIGATTAAAATVTNFSATGTVKFGTYTASIGLTTAGYITITDAGGTSRRLAVV
jgi:hypothetical protein